jgi:hypothetical protein
VLDGVITVLAVLVGGGLTYLVQARLDERKSGRELKRDQAAADRERERDEAAAERQREREQAAEAADLGVATRLLLEELDTLALHHGMLVKERRYPRKLSLEGRRLLFPTNVWETYKPTLARDFSDSAWDAITPYMHTIPRVRAIVLEAEPEAVIEDSIVEQLRNGAIMARDIYEAFAGTPAPSVNERGEPGD